MSEIIRSPAHLLARLADFQQKPTPFTPGEPLFWDDPHISSQMLTVHLSPDVDAASRRSETIDRSVSWLITTLKLSPGDAVLDLGCGPGLYASRLARAGVRITGVDYSQRSIAYATTFARENDLPITYRYQNYLDLDDENQFDTALLIYGDFCPLNPDQRRTLLGHIAHALKPGGRFVLDVSTPVHRRRHGNQNHWEALPSGFWKPGLHLVFEEGFAYPDDIWLDQYIVLEADDTLSVYRNWFQDYTPETITAELACGGFAVESLWGDLTGQAYSSESEWIGLVTKKLI